MPYAINDIISQSFLKGGIKITDKQYQDALNAKLDGLEVKVIKSKLTIIPQEKKE